MGWSCQGNWIGVYYTPLPTGGGGGWNHHTRTYDRSSLGLWHGHVLMSLPIRYPPMASYFQLSIILLTLQILQHPLHQRNLPWPSHEGSRNHHRLYPIPIAPSVWYHVGDLPYDLWTYFPFLVSSLLPDASFHGPTNHRLSHCTIGTLPYALPHMNLVLILLIVCI